MCQAVQFYCRNQYCFNPVGTYMTSPCLHNRLLDYKLPSIDVVDNGRWDCASYTCKLGPPNTDSHDRCRYRYCTECLSGANYANTFGMNSLPALNGVAGSNSLLPAMGEIPLNGYSADTFQGPAPQFDSLLPTMVDIPLNGYSAGTFEDPAPQFEQAGYDSSATDAVWLCGSLQDGPDCYNSSATVGGMHDTSQTNTLLSNAAELSQLFECFNQAEQEGMLNDQPMKQYDATGLWSVNNCDFGVADSALAPNFDPGAMQGTIGGQAADLEYENQNWANQLLWDPQSLTNDSEN